MLKTFTIKEENKNSDRLVESAKHQIRKYIKRERRKPLPEGFELWHFDCKFAKEGQELEVIDYRDITQSIDSSAHSSDTTFTIEIWSKAIKRVRKEDKEETQET